MATTVQSSSPNSLESVASNYQYFVQLCDDPTRRDLTLTTSAIILFIIYAIGIVFQLVVLPANWRLSEYRSAFLLLLHIAFRHT
uniref:G protein-coupled receptor n=1 Tax=Globodera pallida TaxID=36090 RepID=A0A183CBG8_GLOPA